MSQTSALINALKQQLRIHNITYAQVAAHLGLSENSIKRLFSEQKFSLHRLEQVCQLLGMDLSDLMQTMLDNRQRIEMLTEQQEHEIAEDSKLLLMAICVLNHWTFEEVIREYQLSETDCIQLLAKLDRLNIIELLPLNRFKLTVAKNFRWRPNGAIQALFQHKVQADFFQSSFSQPGEKLLFTSGMLSRSANVDIMQKMEKLAVEFDELHQQDIKLPLEQRFGTSLVVAIRPWEFNAFKKLRRDPNSKVF